jgi:hypothetical protein
VVALGAGDCGHCCGPRPPDVRGVSVVTADLLLLVLGRAKIRPQFRRIQRGPVSGLLARQRAAPSAAGCWPHSAADGAASPTGSCSGRDSILLAIRELASTTAYVTFDVNFA